MLKLHLITFNLISRNFFNRDHNFLFSLTEIFPWNQFFSSKYIAFTKFLSKMRVVVISKECALSNEKFIITKKISSNQLFSKFFSITVTFTIFLAKMRESEVPQFPHCATMFLSNNFARDIVEKWEMLSHQKNISSNQHFSNLGIS